MGVRRWHLWSWLLALSLLLGCPSGFIMGCFLTECSGNRKFGRRWEVSVLQRETKAGKKLESWGCDGALLFALQSLSRPPSGAQTPPLCGRGSQGTLLFGALSLSSMVSEGCSDARCRTGRQPHGACRSSAPSIPAAQKPSFQGSCEHPSAGPFPRSRVWLCWRHPRAGAGSDPTVTAGRGFLVLLV